LSTTAKPAGGRGPYVTRDACEKVHAEQREANARTWDELRTLRRLVIMLIVGGQVFSGGVNLAGFGYWLQQHSAQPHAATVQMMAAVRSESREDLRDLRREMHELVASVLARPDAGRSPPAPAPAPPNQGDPL
jgi:hypothetical protein